MIAQRGGNVNRIGAMKGGKGRKNTDTEGAVSVEYMGKA